MAKWSQRFYDAMYRFTKPDWDSGLTPPEVVTFIESDRSRGRALDLGCGTGTQSIYLAQHGFDVTAIDFSPKAIDIARDKAQQADVKIDFRIGDVTRLDDLREPFDLILDIGCLHGLGDEGKSRYAQHIARLSHAGSTMLMFAFDQPAFFGAYHLSQAEAKDYFVPPFDLINVEHGLNRGKSSVAWYTLVRVALSK